MVSPPITEDYYMILEVEQNATPQSIVSAYRRLALKLHPDRNAKYNATEAFQKLGQAYETLSNSTKRRAYDQVYPSIRQSRPSPQTSRPTTNPTSTTSQAETRSEAAQIAAIQKSKQERSAQWHVKKTTFDSSIFEIQRRIRHFEQSIKNIDSIFAAEAAAEARKYSWTTWFLSPIYKQAEESVEEKERKDRERQERRIERDMKERRLQACSDELKTQESLLQRARREVEAADRRDDWEIVRIRAEIEMRENRERREKERQEAEKRQREWEECMERVRLERMKQQKERERQEKERQEKEKQEKLAEYLNRLQAEQRARNARQAQNHFAYSSPFSTSDYTSSCQHHGWWPKVHGRRNCPNCSESWTYLLECPGCAIERCPRCQAELRGARWNRRSQHRRVRTPSPDPFFDWD